MTSKNLPSRTIMLRIDSAAGLAWGVFVLVLHTMVAEVLGLPEGVVLFQAGANLTYGLYSGRLAFKENRSEFSLKFLVGANLAYAFICLGILVYFFDQATLFGRVFLAFEAVVLAGLALFEKRVFFA